MTGTYVLPWHDIGLAGNFNAQSGIVDHAAGYRRADGRRQRTVNVEPLGSYRLPHRTVDFRVFKNTRFGARTLDLSVDFNNITNTNTAWDARELSGTINLRQNGDPNGAINTVPQFGSPAQVLRPAEHPLQRRVPLLRVGRRVSRRMGHPARHRPAIDDDLRLRRSDVSRAGAAVL